MSTTNKEEKVADVSTENIYRLNGRVPLKKRNSIRAAARTGQCPVSNLAPVLIVCSAALVRGTGEHYDFGRDHTSFYNVRCSWQVSETRTAVISGVEDWVWASDCYGSQLYVFSWKPVSNLYQSGTWI